MIRRCHCCKLQDIAVVAINDFFSYLHMYVCTPCTFAFLSKYNKKAVLSQGTTA